MAVVSVEGGPSREALDNVFNLLKNNVQCVEEDQVLDSDEVRGCALCSLVFLHLCDVYGVRAVHLVCVLLRYCWLRIF